MNWVKNRLSIIIPAYKEQETINNLLGHLNKLLIDKSYEIIIVDGEESGSTINQIEKVNKKKITCIIAKKGRANQMNEGAKLSTGDILLFLHADSFLPANAFDLIQETFVNKKYVAGAFYLGLNNPKFIFRITEINVNIRTRITRIPFGDQAIFIQKAYFNKLGGYKNIPIMEDVDLMRIAQLKIFPKTGCFPV